MGIRGFSILSLVIATAIVGAAFTYAQINNVSMRKIGLETADKVIADTYATELLEYLRSQPSMDLIEYLKTNPAGGAGVYPLCAHINIIDRRTAAVINPDPLAALPANPLDGTAPQLRSNRFYQVNVIDLNSMTIKTDPYCNRTALNLPGLTASERLLVTVGVSWVPKGQAAINARRVTMSTVLPR